MLSKKKKRLWAATGQQALEHANICLLNANSTGCEIIKNLVLPGNIFGLTIIKLYQIHLYTI